jgi:clan AA aspartic protease (TIGR02281 family)
LNRRMTAGYLRWMTSLLMLATTTAYAGSSILPLTRSQAGTYYLQGNLDGNISTDFLLDTGSGYVSLTEKTFGQIRDESTTEFRRHIRAAMANGKVVAVPVYSVKQLALGNCILEDIEVMVLPSASRDILGLNAIAALQPLTIQLDPPVLNASCPNAES